MIILESNIYKLLSGNPYLSIAVAICICFGLYWHYYTRNAYPDIPAVGVPPRTGIFGPWLAARRFVLDSAAVLEEGLRKYGPEGRSFRISTPGRWIIVATDPTVLNELKNADERILSMQAAADERNSMSYILSPTIHNNPYHVGIILKYLTKRLDKLVPAVSEEVRLAFEETLPATNQWLASDMHEHLSLCISRTTNRVFVGLPLARDKEFLDCLVKLSAKVSRAGLIIGLVPTFFKPIIASMVVKQSKELQIFMSKLGPLFEERQRTMEKHGSVDDWEDKPNDTVQWILESAPPNTSLYELCIRILYLNFSAIHTSSISLLHAIHDLATRLDNQAEIRAEVVDVLNEFGGCTKEALTKMRKLDSSLRESQRLNPVTTATMMRRAQVSHTLSDGTTLKKGQWVIAPARAINRSTQGYPNPDEFDAFRFSRVEVTGEKTRPLMAYPDNDYLSFGMGRHACPGRFFAALELKIFMAYIIYHYEFETPDRRRPSPKTFSFLCSPDFTAEVLFRRRENVEPIVF